MQAPDGLGVVQQLKALELRDLGQRVNVADLNLRTVSAPRSTAPQVVHRYLLEGARSAMSHPLAALAVIR
jgi:hypothetical protein